MKAFIEIKDCCECPYHDQDNVQTPDSFDNFLDIRCRKVISSDGKGRLICQVDGAEKAPVPDWCPLVAECYKSILKRLKLDYENRRASNYYSSFEKGASSVRGLIDQILQEFKNHCFRNFAYCATERDSYLAAIASELRLPINKFPERCLLDTDDIEIIDKEIETWPFMKRRATAIIEDFKQEKRKNQRNGHSKILKTKLVVPLVILMADIILNRVFPEEKTTVEFKFIDCGKYKNGELLPTKTAELHYHCSGDSVTPSKKLIDYDDETALRRILKEIFGVRNLMIFVNDEIQPQPPSISLPFD